MLSAGFIALAALAAVPDLGFYNDGIGVNIQITCSFTNMSMPKKNSTLI